MRSRSYGNLSVFMQDQTQIDHKKAKGHGLRFWTLVQRQHRDETRNIVWDLWVGQTAAPAYTDAAR